jgi:hypothetical protein
MGFGPHNSPIGNLLENGPHKGGWKSQLDAQRLESAFDLMKNDPRVTLGEALQQVDADLSNIPQSVMNDIVRNQPSDVQARVEQWATDTANSQAFDRSSATTSASPGPGSATTDSSAPMSTYGQSGNTSVGNAVGHGGIPSGNAYGHGVGPSLEPAARNIQNLAQADSTHSPMIQRVFSGEGARMEPANSANAMLRTTGGETLRADTTQGVAMPRESNGDAHRAERTQSNPMPNNPLQRGGEAQGAQRHDGTQNASNLVQSRSDGPTPQQTTSLAAHGGLTAQHAMAQAAPQGAAHAAGFSTQQATAQLASQQAGNRQMGEQAPQQQLNPRAAEATVGSQRVQDARPALAAADPRGFTPQQSLPSQAVQPAQARPELAANQIMPQLAGLTMVANPLISAVSAQPGQNVVPVASGAENASQVRGDALLAPAGHTLAGFLRRHHRGAKRGAEQPLSWLLALVGATRKRRAESRPDAMSLQWVFWTLTVVAYGALAIAIIAMIPSRGRLFDDAGAPAIGAYALLVGAVAVVASWWLGRYLAKRSVPS